MSHLFWLTEARLHPLFRTQHGTPRSDDRRVMSAPIFINRMAYGGEMLQLHLVRISHPKTVGHEDRIQRIQP